MLRIYPVVLTTIQQLRGPVAQLERRNPDLARQLTRCSASVALNIAEGTYSRGRRRQARYHDALGSAREVLACLEVAQAQGALSAPPPTLLAHLNHIIGTLVKLVGPGRVPPE